LYRKPIKRKEKNKKKLKEDNRKCLVKKIIGKEKRI